MKENTPKIFHDILCYQVKPQYQIGYTFFETLAKGVPVDTPTWKAQTIDNAIGYLP